MTPTHLAPYLLAVRPFQVEIRKWIFGEFTRPREALKVQTTTTSQRNPTRPPHSEAQCWEIPSCSELPYQLSSSSLLTMRKPKINRYSRTAINMDHRYPKQTDKSNLEEREFKKKTSMSACGVSGSGFLDGNEGLVDRSWMPLPSISTPEWSGLSYAFYGHFLLSHWNWITMASWWHKTFCSVLYLWKYCCTLQYMLFNGIHEAKEENVWNKKMACTIVMFLWLLFRSCILLFGGIGGDWPYDSAFWSSCQRSGIVYYTSHMQVLQ